MVAIIKEKPMQVQYSLQHSFTLIQLQTQELMFQVSSTDTRKVVLPQNGVVTGISFNGDATGGTTPTIDMGYTDFDGGTTFVDIDGLLNEANADAGAVVTVWGGDATASASLGDVGTPMSERVKIVGGKGASAASGGTITGIIYYYVKDAGNLQT
jgi:hypothetical protein